MSSLAAPSLKSPPNTPEEAHSQRRLVRSGEVQLAVQTWGDPRQPAVVLVHGYPDSSEVWAAVAPQLARHFFVVTYDVRGAGASGEEPGRRAYALERLTADFTAVLDAVCPERRVHLVGHDWGSVQGWEFATSPALRDRIASFTSCSGPCLDHVGHWLRARLRRPTLRGVRELLVQGLRSWYVYFFHLPVLPSLLWRGVLGRAWPAALRHVEGLRVAPRATQARDGANGVNLYRANFLRRVASPGERVAQAPVQILVPLGDHYVSPSLSQGLARWVPELWRREVQGGHWLPLEQPDLFARCVSELVRHIEGGAESAGLRQARVAG